MPIRPDIKPVCSENWDEISRHILFNRPQNRCEWHRAQDYRPDSETGGRAGLTSTHIDYDPTKNDDRNLAPLRQRC